MRIDWEWFAAVTEQMMVAANEAGEGKLEARLAHAHALTVELAHRPLTGKSFPG
jgi:hypothetical protein